MPRIVGARLVSWHVRYMRRAGMDRALALHPARGVVAGSVADGMADRLRAPLAKARLAAR